MGNPHFLLPSTSIKKERHQLLTFMELRMFIVPLSAAAERCMRHARKGRVQSPVYRRGYYA